MKRTVVFTGLVRNEAKFLDFLDRYLTLPECADIPFYFSTWLGELDKYPRVASRLEALNAIILEQAQPDLVLKGHALHQLVAWDLPFGLIKDDVFVYKSRPDFADFISFERFLRYQPVKIVTNQFAELMPQYRFLVMGLFGAQPFYMNDITFAGMAVDLRRLTSLSMVGMVRYFRVAPEQMIWLPQFLRQNSALDAFFRANVGLIFNNDELSRKNIDALQDYPAYIHALAFYFLTIQCAVDFFEDTVTSADANASCMIVPYKTEQLLWEPIKLETMGHHSSCLNNLFSGKKYINAMLEGRVAPSHFGHQLQVAAASLKTNQGYFEVGFFNTDVAQYAQFSADALTLPGAKIIRRQGNRSVVNGAATDWHQANLGTSTTEKLEAEVNYLRRTLNDLEHQVSTAAVAKTQV